MSMGPYNDGPGRRGVEDFNVAIITFEALRITVGTSG